MERTEVQQHDDDFAKIVRTPSGRQVLVYSDTDSETDTPQVVMRTSIEGAVISFSCGFKDTDEGYDLRDKMLSGYDQQKAAQFEAMALGAVLGRQGEL